MNTLNDILSKFPFMLTMLKIEKVLRNLQRTLGTQRTSTKYKFQKMYERSKTDLQKPKMMYQKTYSVNQHSPVHLSQDENTHLLSPIKVAERFTIFFVSIGREIANTISVDIDTTPCFKTNSSAICLEDVTAGEVNQTIERISENKATRIDTFSAKYLNRRWRVVFSDISQIVIVVSQLVFLLIVLS